jgi:hypothetical protein
LTLGVHLVSREIVGLHRFERTRAHVQNHVGRGRSRRAYSVERRFGEMEPGGWGRHAPVGLREHGLVAVSIVGLGGPVHVRWQRHVTVPLHQLIPIQLAGQPHCSQPPSDDPGNLEPPLVAEGHRAADLELPAGVDHGEPIAVRFGMNE